MDVKRYIWLTVFAVAMAYLETTVVVYLRLLYYPEGFDFPLIVVPTRQLLVELGREAATIVMLVAVGRLGARGFWSTLAGFMFLFGVWDILYYVWLKLLLDWPASLLTWDILFLVPTPWVGPVLAPVLISVSLIGAALALEWAEANGRPLRAGPLDWGGVILGGLVVITSFCLDWRRVLEGGTPQNFPWWLFAAGELLALVVFLNGMRRTLARPVP